MSGTPANASLWSDADVYIAPIGTAIPADASTAFSGSWNLVGLLDGDEGFEESRDQDVKDHYAWGGILVATTRAQFKLTKKFTVLEDNATTRALIWPGSSSSQLLVPKPIDLLIAFETRTGGKVRRLITHSRAQVDVDGSIKDDETDLTAVTLVATIYPDSAGVLFDIQGKPTVSSIAITPLTLALSLSGSNIKKLTATATYSDATTADVSSSVTWVSSVPAKATVAPGGYVTGVATGVTNVSCNLGGVNSTAPSVVTVSA